jgi:hypothetical protein
MNEPEEAAFDELRDCLAALPAAQASGAELEERTVRALRAKGQFEIRPAARHGFSPTWRRIGWIAAAAVLAIAVSRPWQRLGTRATSGASYLLLLYEGAGYRAPAPAQRSGRVAEYRRWADSLGAIGRLERAAELDGQGPVAGFFIVRAESEAQAETLARDCPHTKYGGRVEVRKLIE